MPTAISDADFDKEVLKSSLPVVVDFWAPWCGPCKAMLPIIEELDAELKDKVRFVKLNVDENSDVANKFNVMSIPTFIIFKDGEAKKTFVGTKSKEDMRGVIDEAVL
jgi:thioredoxin 1